MFMKKILKVVVGILEIIVVLGIVFFTVDYNKVKNQEKPIFCIKSPAGGIMDGGTIEYLGLGYKVIDFHTIAGFDDIKIGTWFMDYNDFEEEIKAYEKKYKEKLLMNEENNSDLENVIMKVDSTTIKTTSISIIIINNTDNEIGYPNDEYGVCTDVVAFGLKDAGYDLMELVNEDIHNNREKYNIETVDKNIDFRRVRNLDIYFRNNHIVLTTDLSQIKEWQGGDIIVFKDHIGIISDKRNKKGIPLLIHHANPLQVNYEEDVLELYGQDYIIGHYRIS